jgi:beta-lactamase class A
MKRKILWTPALLTLAIIAGRGAAAPEIFASRPAADSPPASQFQAFGARWTLMKTAVSRKIDAFRGDVGLIVKDMKTGLIYEVNPDLLFPSASMVKIPIMAACLKAAEEGRLSLDDTLKLKRSDKARGAGTLRRRMSGSIIRIDELIEAMIIHSDNTATNMLIDRLGFDYLNSTFRELGLEKTNLSRKMMDFRKRAVGLENYTTAREMADVLEMIYRHDCICSEVSEKCLEVLKEQRVNDRIPRYLPRNAVVAHKTGMERQVCHDAGIVFTDNGDFLISVFTRTYYRSGYAKRFIGRIANLVYDVYRDEPLRSASAASGRGRASG